MDIVSPLSPKPQAESTQLAPGRRIIRRSIAWVFVTYMALVVILTLGLVAAANDWILRASLISEQQKQLADRASLQAEQVYDFRNEQFRALLQIVDEPILLASDNQADLQHYLEQVLPRAGRFFALGLVSREGKTLAATSNQLLAVGFASTPWFNQAQAGITGVSHLQLMPSSSVPVFFFYIPLKAAGGSPERILVGLLPATELWKFVDPVKVGQSGYAYMVDDNAVLIAHGSRDPTTGQPTHAMIFSAVGSLDAPLIQSANAAALYGEKQITKSASVEDLALFILGKPPLLVRGNPTANVKRYYFPQQKADKTSIVAPVGSPNGLGASIATGPNDWVFGITVDDTEFFGPLNRLRQALVMVSGVCILLSVLVGIWAAFSISRPARRLAEMARRVQAGDYSARSPIHSNDEIGQLAAAMNAMLDRLSEAMQIQQDQIQTLLRTGAETSHSAISLSASAEEMAAAAEELSSSSEQVTQAVQGMSHDADIQMNHVQQTARQINNLDQEISRIVCLSNELNQASGQMRELASQAEQAIQETHQLTHRVQSVLHLIERFGRQTNMLALNATIEAIRAGEMGASFVVVAEEVSRLAESSEQALHEIDGLNKAIRESINTVQSSVGQTGQSVLVVAAMAAELAAAASRQSQTSAGLVEVTNRLAAIAETNAAGTEQIASSIEQQASAFSQISSSSHELAVLAQKLQGLSHQLVGTQQPETERVS